ncbi:MAG: phenylalanine--tRNA ligase subunit beta [Hyphomicrobiales bacterium]|nr:phenylalanine--tRNA ligase subunit beta [Hyphomicrobiales bacterium]
MKFTLSWLKQHLDTEATLEEITDALNMIGLEVESVDDKSAFKPFVIARVLTAEQHPDADRLRVLSVDTGSGDPVQVVCGAPNARAGLVGAFAAPGTYVPGIDLVLTVGKIRGVESHGMMCSERELQMSDEHDGIIDLEGEFEIGSSFAAQAGLDDPVIEIGLTPNRPDCTGVRGIARDLAAYGLGTLKDGHTPPAGGTGPCPVNLTLDFGDTQPLCLGFALRMVRGVENRQSPLWMQQRLTSIGLRPINALVDITNYVTFDRGRPLHVFDASKVHGDLVVRRGREGESVRALDEREYDVNGEICVIADDNGVESIAGIMGGEGSGCDENTTDVLIESALWDPYNIARTGRDLGIITDARYRFERGVDPAYMAEGMEFATKLVLELCGGAPTEAIITGYEAPLAKVIDFPVSEVKRLTGIDVSRTESLDILDRLGFESSGDGDIVSVSVSVPTWRPDIDGKADLVEEVMRIHGVNRIDPQPLPRNAIVGERILTTLQIRTRAVRRALASRGMLEAVNWSFVSAELAEIFGGGSDALKLANPIAADMSDMRPSLLPGLLSSAQRNADKGHGDLTLFEVSDSYSDDTYAGQHRVAAGIRRGTARLEGGGRHWNNGSPAVSVFDAKADALAALEACGAPVSRVQIEAGGPDWFHPGRRGTIKLGPKIVLGTFGEFHPRTLDKMGVAGPVCGFEIDIDAVPEPKRKPTRTKTPLEISPFQALKRDFAFVVNSSVAAAEIVKSVAAADKKLIADVSVFDLFEGPSLGEDKKSVAVEVDIQPTDRTLTDADLEALAEQIIENVSKKTGGVLRG